MDDFIALSCPSCGGQIQVEKDLEKIFCLHCGSELMLKQGADGLLIPLKAKDLNASVRMQETETRLLLMETLKEQIKELEAQLLSLKISFWTHVMLGGVNKKYIGHIYKETDTIRRVNLYSKQLTGIQAIVISKVQLSNDDLLNPEKLAQSSIIGFTTPEELLAFYQYLVQPQGYDQIAYQMALLLHPVTSLVPNLIAKKLQIKQVANELFNEFMGSLA